MARESDVSQGWFTVSDTAKPHEPDGVDCTMSMSYRMLLINIVSCSSAILMSSVSFAFSCFPGTEDIGSTESAIAHDVAMDARQDLLHP
jgi:hypothetical protein